MDKALWMSRGKRWAMYVLNLIWQALVWFNKTRIGNFTFNKLPLWIVGLAFLYIMVIAPVMDTIEEASLLRECKFIHKVEACKLERTAVPVK